MTIPVGFAQCTVIMAGAAVPSGAVWTMGVDNSTALSASAVATAFGIALSNSGLIATLSNSIGTTGVLAKLGPDATGASAVQAASLLGAQASTAVPPNTSILVRKITNLGGRRGRGRFFLPGMAEGSVDSGGDLEATFEATVQACLVDLQAELISADIPPVLLHDGPTVPTPITVLAISPIVATQRRRLRR